MKTAREWADELIKMGFLASVDVEVKRPLPPHLTNQVDGIVDLCTVDGPSRFHLEIRANGAVLIEADENGQCGELTDETDSLMEILEALLEVWPEEDE